MHLLWTRMLMVVVSTVIYYARWQSIALLLGVLWMAFQTLYWQPHLQPWVNHVRIGMHVSLAWCALLYMFNAFTVGACGGRPGAGHGVLGVAPGAQQRGFAVRAR